jgi:hypothetical protein
VILRVFRYGLHTGTQASFEDAADSVAMPAFAATAGLCFAWGGRRFSTPRRGVLVSGWATYDALVTAVGGRIDQPRFLPAEAVAAIESCDISHWEALDVDPMPAGEATILRVASGTVEGAEEAMYFRYLREEVWPVLGGVAGLAGAYFGRQSEGRAVDPIVSISLWRSMADLEALGATDGPVFPRYSGGILKLGPVELYDVYAATQSGVE